MLNCLALTSIPKEAAELGFAMSGPLRHKRGPKRFCWYIEAPKLILSSVFCIFFRHLSKEWF